MERLQSAVSGLALRQTGPCLKPPDPPKKNLRAGIPQGVYNLGLLGAKKDILDKTFPPLLFRETGRAYHDTCAIRLADAITRVQPDFFGSSRRARHEAEPIRLVDLALQAAWTHVYRKTRRA